MPNAPGGRDLGVQAAAYIPLQPDALTTRIEELVRSSECRQNPCKSVEELESCSSGNGRENAESSLAHTVVVNDSDRVVLEGSTALRTVDARLPYSVGRFGSDGGGKPAWGPGLNGAIEVWPGDGAKRRRGRR